MDLWSAKVNSLLCCSVFTGFKRLFRVRLQQQYSNEVCTRYSWLCFVFKYHNDHNFVWMIWTIWCELFSLCVVWMKNYDNVACLGQCCAHYNNADWDNYSPGIATVLIVNATFNMDMWGHAAVVTSTYQCLTTDSQVRDENQFLSSETALRWPNNNYSHEESTLIPRDMKNTVNTLSSADKPWSSYLQV